MPLPAPGPPRTNTTVGFADPEEGAEPSAPAGAASSPLGAQRDGGGGERRGGGERAGRGEPEAPRGDRRMGSRGHRRVTLGDHEGRADLVGARWSREHARMPWRAGHLAHHLTVEHLTSWGSIGCLGEWRSGPRFCFDSTKLLRVSLLGSQFKHFRPPRRPCETTRGGWRTSAVVGGAPSNTLTRDDTSASTKVRIVARKHPPTCRARMRYLRTRRCRR